MKDFRLCFVPLFVAVKTIGVLPLFLNLRQAADDSHSRRTVPRSVVAALTAGPVFAAPGGFVLTFPNEDCR
jgi:small neutral amino acid transporter SnatA (MarC family)